jgi:hypothetical protein
LAVLSGLGLASLGGYVFMAASASPSREPSAIGRFILIYTGLFAVYLVASYLALRARNTLPLRPTLALIAVVAVAGRGILIFSPPTLSNDMYRYIWDGRVMAAGLSPYAYAPGNPAVEALHPPGYRIWDHINRKSAITIYPPGAEVFFAGVYRIYPDSVTWTKGAMVLVDLASCVLLLLILGRLSMPLTRVLVYAWAPLPIVEFASSGHMEALSVLWTLAAILAGVVAVQRMTTDRGRPTTDHGPRTTDDQLPATNHGSYALRIMHHASRSSAVIAGVCLAAAGLVKLIPLLLLAAWVRRFGWKFAALCVGLFALVYTYFVFVTGGHISNFLVTYLRYEHNNAPVYALLTEFVAKPIGISDDIVRVVLLAALAAVALAVAIKRDVGTYSFITKSFVLVGAYLLLTTNAHPWYATWLLLFLPLVVPPGGLLLSGNPDRHDGPWLRGDYGPALAALLYAGITFWGYSLFALGEPTVPLEISTVQLGVALGLGVLWPRASRRSRGGKSTQTNALVQGGDGSLPQQASQGSS